MKQKRNLDLIRELLIWLEGEKEVDLSAYSEDEVKYNKYLIVDAGLAEGKVIREPLTTGGNKERRGILKAELYYLTSKGQDFLADARTPEVWEGVKSKLAAKGAEASLAVIQALLKATTLEYFGLN